MAGPHSALESAIVGAVESRNASFLSGSRSVVALCCVFGARNSLRVKAVQSIDALRDIYATSLPADAKPGSTEELHAINALVDKSLNELLNIIHQCHQHASVIQRRLDLHSMVEEFEKVKPPEPATDRFVAHKAPCFAQSLPSDCWGVIAEYLPIQDIMQLPFVSRQLFEGRDLVVWNTLYARCFGINGAPLSDGQTWRQEVKSKVCPMISSSYGRRCGGLPGVAAFLEDVAPKGSFAMGRKNLLITRTDPVRMLQAMRHGSQTVRLEVDEVSTSRGPFIFLTVIHDAVGFESNFQFDTFANGHLSTTVRSAVASVVSVAPDATVQQ